MAALLDLNALIALLDADHVDHAVMSAWFVKHHRAGWATCPITENGLVRVISQPTYPSGQRTPTEVVQVLQALKDSFPDTYQFWPDNVSLTNGLFFDKALIAGTRQVTDTYLLGLAAHNEGTMVSFDRGLVWQAVRGASRRLIQHPGKA